MAARVVAGSINVRRLLLLDPPFWVDVLSIVPFYAVLVLTSADGAACAEYAAGVGNMTAGAVACGAC